MCLDLSSCCWLPAGQRVNHLIMGLDHSISKLTNSGSCWPHTELLYKQTLTDLEHLFFHTMLLITPWVKEPALTRFA